MKDKNLLEVLLSDFLFNLDIVELLGEIEMINTRTKTFDSGRCVLLCSFVYHICSLLRLKISITQRLDLEV